MSLGHPVPIIVPDGNGFFKLDEVALKEIIQKEELEDHNVVCVSIVGVFRKGKSFLLNFFVRYLEALCSDKRELPSWMGSDDETLEGFEWKTGPQAVTSGILMWSEVFLTKNSKGQKVAIILLDTEGTWDINGSVRESTFIFGLSTLLSSFQIYNIPNQVNTNDLQNLEFFINYAKYASSMNSKATPFQNLMFLVGGWEYPFQTSYGSNKAMEAIQGSTATNHKTDSQKIWTNLNSCYSKISGFLMPKPMCDVNRYATFRGQLKDIDPEFKKCLEELVQIIFSLDHLTPKTINGEYIKIGNFYECIKTYVEALSRDDLVKPESLWTYTLKITYQGTLQEATKCYQETMKNRWTTLLNNTKTNTNTNTNTTFRMSSFEYIHEASKEEAITLFRSKDLGETDLSGDYERKLKKNIDQIYMNYKRMAIREYGLVVVRKATDNYKNSQQQLVDQTNPFFKRSGYIRSSENSKADAVSYLERSMIMYGDEVTDSCKLQLLQNIKKLDEEHYNKTAFWDCCKLGFQRLNTRMCELFWAIARLILRLLTNVFFRATAQTIRN